MKAFILLMTASCGCLISACACAPSHTSWGEPELQSKLPVARVVIEKKPVETIRRTFDPSQAPSDMPELPPDSAALTKYEFSCASTTNYVVHTDERRSEPKATARIETLTLTLGLKITIWLPADAAPRLCAYQEGVRAIAELHYDGSDTIAQQLGDSVGAQVFTATGRDCENQIKGAVDEAVKTIGEKWIAAVATPTGRVEAIYAEITDRGRSPKVLSNDTIRQSVQRYERETKPTLGSSSLKH
jgi:hypothetical protein